MFLSCELSDSTKSIPSLYDRAVVLENFRLPQSASGIIKTPRKDSNRPNFTMIILLFDATERNAAAALSISLDTLRKRRLAGKIPPHCYVKYGYKCVRYCLPLLQDWQLAPDDLEAQARAIALLEPQRPSNQPVKRGRKFAA